MTMKLYNTLSRKIETVKPLSDHRLKMYTCGLTVYSQPQIGNWVAYIYSDVLTRTLKISGFNVQRIQNITDVGHLVSDDDSGEDKMEKGAKAEGLSAWEVAKKYTEIANHEAYDMLGLERPEKLVPATSLIKEQIDFVRSLEQKDLTYIIENEGVYFDTSKIADYGKLAKLNIAGLQAGARVEVNGKRNITDFALWKFSPKNVKRDMEWESPWGKGFPGWHLECSVIAREYLGDQIDIHTGGIDHIPVHHTNEIAQTESLTGKPFVSYWFHNNHMKINGAKMAKSTGNSYTLQELADRGYNLNAFKLMVLSSHYRTEGNFTWDILDAAQHRYNHWQSVIDRAWQVMTKNRLIANEQLAEQLKESHALILKHLQNDLDTPAVLREIDQVLNKLDTVEVDTALSDELNNYFDFLDQALGIVFERQDISGDQKQLIHERELARDNKDFATSDTIRDELLKQGIAIRDTASGTVWQHLSVNN